MNQYLDAFLKKIINQKQKQLKVLRPLPKGVVQRLKEKLIVDFTYNSNAIEGNSLTLKETAAVLASGITISGKPLKDHLEAINHKEALEFLEKVVSSKEKINLSTILNFHKIILTKINDLEAGRFRHERVLIKGAKHIPPNHLKVYSLMKDFENWLNKKDNLHPVEKAALAHFKLVYIHPFIDGNGRTARLLANLILMQRGYPPTVLLAKERYLYMQLLEKADSGNLAPFVNYIGKNCESALDLWLWTVKGKEDYLTLSQIAKDTPYSAEYLSLLSRQRKLAAIKIDGNWRVTKEGIKKYLRGLKERRK